MTCSFGSLSLKMCTETARIKSTPELNHLRIYALLYFFLLLLCRHKTYITHTSQPTVYTTVFFSLSLYPLITNMCLFSSHDHPGTSITHASSLFSCLSRERCNSNSSSSTPATYVMFICIRACLSSLLGAGTGIQLCRYSLVLMARFNNNSLMMAE